MASSSCCGSSGTTLAQIHSQTHSNSSLPRRVPTTPTYREAPLISRRQTLLMLTVSTVLLTAVEKEAKAVDIPLFGLRKKLKKVEEQAEEIVKEGVETAERGIETAERELFTVEKEIETAGSTGFGGLAQAGVVVGAEAVGVLVATSVVNGILGPE